MKNTTASVPETPMNLHSPASRSLAWVLTATLTLNPMAPALAQITVANGTTTLGQAGNGVPVVNIAAPNARGLSHNRFTDYNVGSQGLILNNATDAVQKTGLGGHILGNPHLGDRAASLILNEVTGGRPSQLSGYTEIAGKAARLVIANPWGIACNGCGFLNTPRVTLSTGTPLIDDGRLAGFRVEGGEISIAGTGLNASNVDQFDLVTRSARLNAELYAQRLNVIAGRNEVDADDLSATALAAGDGAPLLAIDSSALGGMYANSIVLLGTEAGVGVRLAGDLAASAGDIRIDAQGKLSVANAAAAGRIDARAGALETHGQLYAGSQLELAASGDLVNHKTLAARDAVVLSSGATLTNHGHVEAGVNADNSRNAAGDVQLVGQNVVNSGSLVASRHLQADVGQILDNREGRIASGSGLAVRASGLNQAGGELFSQGSLSLDLNGGALNNDEALIHAAGPLLLSNLGAASNRGGEISSVESLGLSADSLNNRGGRLLSGQGLALSVEKLFGNVGGLVSAQSLDLSAARLDNTAGRIASRGDLLAQVGELEQIDGELLAEGDLTLSGQRLNNQGGTLGANGELTLEVAEIDNRGGEISTRSGARIEADKLDNRGGTLLADQLALSAGQVRNSEEGLIYGEKAVQVDGTDLDNQGGTLASDTRLSVVLDGDLRNAAGLLASEGVLNVTAKSLDNRGGSLSSADALAVEVAGALHNQGGRILTDAELSLRSAGLDNRSGVISAAGALAVETGDFNNNQGQVTSEGRLDLLAGQVGNAGGRIASAGALDVRASGLDQAGGELFSRSSLSLDLNGGTLNNDGALLSAPGDLLLSNLGEVTNRGGEISSAKGFILAATRLDNAGGRLLSEQVLSIVLGGALDNRAGTLSGQRLALSAASVDNRTAGLIRSGSELSLQVTGKLINDAGRIASRGDLLAQVGDLEQIDGELLAEGNLTLSGQRLDNQGGTLGANGELTLKVAEIDNRGGEISTRSGARIEADKLDNRGGTLLADQLTLSAGQVRNSEEGLIYGEKAVQVDGTDLDNQGGTLASDTRLSVVLDGDLHNAAGLLASEGALNVTAKSLDNQGGSLSSADALAVEVAGALYNQGGRILTDAELSLRSAGLDNRSGVISAAGALSLSTGAFDNSQGQLTGSDRLDLLAGQVGNAGGRIASVGALDVRASGLDQAGGELFSRSSLSLDLNGGTLNNDGALLSAPGDLLLSNLGEVSNRGGEISSAKGFTLAATRLDNAGGRLLSEQVLSVVLGGALDNRAGLVSAWDLALAAARLDNGAGTLFARNDLSAEVDTVLHNAGEGLIQAGGGLLLSGSELDNRGGYVVAGQTLALTLDGALDNRDGGLVTSQGGLELTAGSLDSSQGGEVSAKGDLQLRLGALVQQQGMLIGEGALSVDLRQGDLDNQGGLISSGGRLDLKNLGSLDNREGEISSLGVLALAATHLDNRAGTLIGRDWLNLILGTADNRGGLLSGWQGLALSAGSLDNRAVGTVSSRSGDLDLQLTGDLLNSGEGALVAAGRLDLAAAGLDNRAQGILSSGAGQTLAIGATLDNRGGQIDSGTALAIDARRVDNQGGLLRAGQTLAVAAGDLDNRAGHIGAGGDARLELDGTLLNADGQLASGGVLNLSAAVLDNRGGTVASQNAATVDAGSLDNSARGTLAANGALEIRVDGTVDNRGDGLIYSRDATVQLAAGTLDNQGGALQSQGDLSLELDGDLLNAGGTLQSQAGDVALRAANLDNRLGTLASLEGEVRALLSGWLNNGAAGQDGGGLIQGQRLDLAATGTLFNEGGRIHALGGDAGLSAAAFDNRQGVLHARDALRLTGGGLDNRAGTLGAGSIDLRLSGAIDNREGIVESSAALAIRAASLDNRDGQLRALGEQGETVLQLGGLLDNRAGVLESANRDLSVEISELRNQGGSLVHAGGGEFGIASAQAAEAGGRIVTAGGLTLSAESWHNSSVLQAGRLTLEVGTFTQSASGQVLASESLTGTGTHWTNDGLIASDGTLSLALTGGYGGAGRLSSVGGLDLSAASLELAALGTIAAGGKATFQFSAQADNLGRITAAGSLDFTAAQLNNRGTLGSAEDLTLDTPDLLNEEGLIFSGGDMALHADRFINRHADVYALGGLLIRGAGTQDSAEKIENRSGSIESVGNMGIRANTLENTADVFEISRKLLSGGIAVRCIDCRGDHYTVDYFVREYYQTEIDADAPAHITAGGDFSFVGTTFANRLSTLSAAGDIGIETGQFSNEGAVSGTIERTRIYRHGPVTDGTVGRYIQSHIYPYNLRNNPDYLEWDDEGIPYSNSYYDPDNLLEFSPTTSSVFKLWSDLEVSTTTPGEGQGAVIQAGGAVSITASENLNNGVISHDYAYQQGGQTQDVVPVAPVTTTVVELNPQLPPDLAQQQVNPLTLPGFSLPTGQNGLFRLSGETGSEAGASTASGAADWSLSAGTLGQAQRTTQVDAPEADGVRIDGGGLQASTTELQSGERAQTAPAVQAGEVQVASSTAADGGAATPGAQGVAVEYSVPKHPYLIETNPALTELAHFLGSDYLLGLLGEDGDTSWRRLGDGLYEQRLIREAVVARTGQRYLAGLGSDEAMYRYLMDNAVASKDALNLSVGVSLTAEQVAALTHDIVWLEAYEVNGEEVLVPVLYLAQAEGRLGPTGALIQGSDLALIAGDTLANRGTLRADGNLSATAGQVVNSGLLEAGDRLSVLAVDSVLNTRGGILAGRDVDVTALTGDLINERTVTEFTARASGLTFTRSLVDTAGRIEAGGDLVLSAGRDLYNLGSVVSAGGGVELSAGGDLIIAAVEDRQSSFARIRRGTYSTEYVTQLGSEVSAGGDLALSAGQDLAVIASRVQAGGDAFLLAGGDLTLEAAADVSHTDYRYRSSRKKIHDEKLSVRQQAAEVEAGGNLLLAAGEDLTLVASAAQAGGEAYLYAGQELALLSAENQDYSLYEKKKKGSFGRKKMRRDEVTVITQVGSQVSAGESVTLESGGDQTYQVAKLTSGGDLTLDSGGEIAFEGMMDLKQESHQKSKSSFAWQSAKGKGKTDETLRQSELVAGGELAIRAADRISIDIKEVNAQTVSQTIDALVQAEPQLAWLKEMEARGDVDWQRVKEVHDQWKYSHSGMGPGLALVVAIVVTVMTWGAASSAVAGVTNAAVGTATNTALTAAATSAMSNMAINTINSGGDLGEALKLSFSGDAMKGYVTSALVAGITAGYIDEALGGKTDPVTGKVSGFNLSDFSDVGRFAVHQAARAGVSATVSTAINGGSFSDNLAAALTSAAVHTVSAGAFNLVGDLGLDNGSIEKILVKALVGGLISQAATGDFATGALAAGANEALVDGLAKLVDGDPQLLSMASQLVGAVSSAVSGGDAQLASDIANYDTQYNYLNHQNLDDLVAEARSCEALGNCDEVRQKFRALSVANDDGLVAACNANAQDCIQRFGSLLEDSQGIQERLAELYFDDSIPSLFKWDLHVYQMQNLSATGVLAQAGAQVALENRGLSPDAAALAAAIVGSAASGGVPGKGGAKGVGNGAKFADQAKLDDHFARHGSDFGARNALEYQSQADRFLTVSKPVGVLEKVRPNGDVVRYNPATDEFGVISSSGNIRTYYKPDPAVHGKGSNLDYFNAQ
ncbi:two-partner secretion domain-containing protein [Pseudothauera nasutitermitis]|nr:DUF637 domain-containing protein [Pseudothauera nasutitermitis]